MGLDNDSFPAIVGSPRPTPVVKPAPHPYVLVTPARNEAQFLGHTIESVIAQTALPRAWIIVSDGSTDGTDEVVRSYLDAHPWMRLLKMPERRDRQFAAKVQAFNAGYRELANVEYEVIGNLDADITFEPDYLEWLVHRFTQDEKLGVAGTPFVEDGACYDYRYTNVEHVSGACQLFRRRCFEEIGGYQAVKGGGIDWIAVTTARMKGWRTRTFVEKTCHHHRPMGTGNSTLLGASFKLGQQDYYLGGHPLWQLFRAGFQLTRRPYVLSGILLLAGYLWALVRGAERPVSKELITFHQAEQLRRLREKTLRPFGIGRTSGSCAKVPKVS